MTRDRATTCARKLRSDHRLRGLGDCVPTGDCVDETAIDAFPACFHGGVSDRKTITSGIFRRREGGQEDCEHQYSDETFKELCEGEFYADGNLRLTTTTDRTHHDQKRKEPNQMKTKERKPPVAAMVAALKDRANLPPRTDTRRRGLSVGHYEGQNPDCATTSTTQERNNDFHRCPHGFYATSVGTPSATRT